METVGTGQPFEADLWRVGNPTPAPDYQFWFDEGTVRPKNYNVDEVKIAMNMRDDAKLSLARRKFKNPLRLESPFDDLEHLGIDEGAYQKKIKNMGRDEKLRYRDRLIYEAAKKKGHDAVIYAEGGTLMREKWLESEPDDEGETETESRYYPELMEIKNKKILKLAGLEGDE